MEVRMRMSLRSTLATVAMAVTVASSAEAQRRMALGVDAGAGFEGTLGYGLTNESLRIGPLAGISFFPR